MSLRAADSRNGAENRAAEHFGAWEAGPDPCRSSKTSLPNKAFGRLVGVLNAGRRGRKHGRA